MIPASDLFKQVLSSSHTAITRALVFQPTQDNTYVQTDELAVAAGNLTVDGTRNIWRQATLELAPRFSVDPAPLNAVTAQSRLKVQRGIKFLDGTTEWVTIATLMVQASTRELGNGTLKVTAYDPSSVIDGYALITPYAPIGPDQRPLSIVEAIKDLVDIALWETAVWHIDPSIDQTAMPPAGTVFTGSRWDAINKLAKSVSGEVHVDPEGEWHLDRIETTNYQPVWTLATGPGGVLISGTYARDRRDIYNAVPLRWEGPTGGGLVFLVDADPASPTYWNGPWGRKPASEQSVETVTNEQQAREAAEALLAQYKGFTASVTFDSIHNPLLEPKDVIEVVVDAELHQLHVIDSINYPLAGGAMSCETRAVREVAA